MSTDPRTRNRRRRNAGLALGIVGAHLAVFAVISRDGPDAPARPPPPRLAVLPADPKSAREA